MAAVESADTADAGKRDVADEAAVHAVLGDGAVGVLEVVADDVAAGEADGAERVLGLRDDFLPCAAFRGADVDGDDTLAWRIEVC